jgi:hypothetical protein
MTQKQKADISALNLIVSRLEEIDELLAGISDLSEESKLKLIACLSPLAEAKEAILEVVNNETQN